MRAFKKNGDFSGFLRNNYPGRGRATVEKAPLTLEIKGNSLDDGPGIRTVVFLKGCPLSCVWCHNPESKSAGHEISYDMSECIGCDTCLDTCPEGALSKSNRFFVDRDKCSLCFECTSVCPSGALSKVGIEMTVDDIVAQVIKDKPFFDNSGGGVTLSGGEPTLFMPFLARLLAAFKERGIHTLLETCGQFGMDSFDANAYPHLDLIYYDIKLVDDRAHRRLCGTGNKVILSNFETLYSRYQKGGVDILPRIPLIPGMTDTAENIDAIVSFLNRLDVSKVELMPYHPLWQDKNLKVGIENSAVNDRAMSTWMSRERLEECKDVFRRASIDV